MSTPNQKKLFASALAAEKSVISDPSANAPPHQDDTDFPNIATMPVRMPPLSMSEGTEPLTDDQVQLADRIARRLHEHFRTFLAGLPPEHRTASGLARVLNVDRTTCQRLVFTANRPYTGLAMIGRMPGVRGLRQIIEAAKRNTDIADADTTNRLKVAIDSYEQALRRLGGSQSALVRRINATPTDSAESSSAEEYEHHGHARRRLFDAATELTGRFSETWVAVYVYTPDERSEQGRLEIARVHGLIGHLARPDAVPLTFHNFDRPRGINDETADEEQHAFRSLGAQPAPGNAPQTVLPEFSSDPLPVVTSRQPNEFLVQAIDADPHSSRQPVDLMLGTCHAVPHPASQPSGVSEIWALINFPVRCMVFDVYMHRDLARECIPSLDLHLWRPDFAANIGDRWQTRFADAPRLEVLGSGIDRAATPAYSRHEELTRFLFRRLDLEPGRFVGYRCFADYPIWRTGYCMSFDFSTSEADEG